MNPLIMFVSCSAGLGIAFGVSWAFERFASWYTAREFAKLGEPAAFEEKIEVPTTIVVVGGQEFKVKI